MPPLDSKYISISGLPTYGQVAIPFPSGLFGVQVNANLSSLNATFGLNENPHRLDLEYIPETFHDNSLPEIGAPVSMQVGAFYFAGRVVHADFNRSDKGNIMSISIEDIRKDLRHVTIDTFGVFGADENPSAPIVDVVRWAYEASNSRAAWNIEQRGATYPEIIQAIGWAAGKGCIDTAIINYLPSADILAKQLGNINKYRWSFKSTPLLNALIQIFNDCACDIYWGMREGKFKVIDRKQGVEITENSFPLSGEKCSLRFGQDEGERPTAIHIFGAQKEGIPGYGSKTTGNGVYGPIGAGVGDLGISVNSSLTPAWRGTTIKYYDGQGIVCSYKPTDRQLAAAIKGIEYWAREMGLENRIDEQAIKMGAGRTTKSVRVGGLVSTQREDEDQPAIQTPSDLGQIQNRGRPDAAWQIEWYNRVRTFAQNYFGRAYQFAGGDLVTKMHEYDIVDAAWCGLENLSRTGSFTEGYQLPDAYKELSPFWDSKTNRLRAFAVMPSKTLWGTDGKGTPAAFDEYNEGRDGTQYVPIEVRQWKEAKNKFSEEFIEGLSQPQGVMIILPNIAFAAGSFDHDDPVLANIPSLKEYKKRFLGICITKEGQFTVGTQFDMITNPMAYGEVLEQPIGVAIPIRVQKRYGYGIWSDGSSIGQVIVDDDLAPWNYSPMGSKDYSWSLMDADAKARMAAGTYSREYVTFAECVKLGEPQVSFDNFADNEGKISHGITNINLTKSLSWWQTKYSLKTHYPQIVKAKPTPEPIEEEFKYIYHTQASKKKPVPQPWSPAKPWEPEVRDGRAQFIKPMLNKFDVVVTITTVIDDGDFNYYYEAEDDNGVKWPAMSRAGLGGLSTESLYYKLRKAYCTDGFLQAGMAAVYHYEDLDDGGFIHYFTGGVMLSASRIVELWESPRMVEGVWRANVRTLPETVFDNKGNAHEVQPFYLFNVPFLNQQTVDPNLKKEDKMYIGSTGHVNNTVVRPNMDVQTGGKYTSGKDSVQIINGGAASTVYFAVVITPPNKETGEGGAIQTIGVGAGQQIFDGMKRKGETFFHRVRFIGLEYDCVAIGDPCIITTGREENGDLRYYCFIMKPLFAPHSAFGDGPFIT